MPLNCGGSGITPYTMQLDARELDEFYETAMGQVARRMILRRLRLLWPQTERCRVLGYGFAVPYLRSFHSESERVAALMPAQQGVIGWPDQSHRSRKWTFPWLRLDTIRPAALTRGR